MSDLHAIYPGTFDPVTLGHCDVLARALRLFDRITVAVSRGGRATLFDVNERVDLVREAVAGLGDKGRIEVVSFDGLLVDAMRRLSANVAIRGLRTPGDMEHEQNMAAMNRSLVADYEVLVFFARPELAMLSGTLVRDVARCGGPVERYVPAAAATALRARFAADG
ncbi:pantetheine-phosphate adenylyltransferase [bacterium]|nr:pantetheine-phosphate adenylyltransferase [bacterium]MBU1071819.1 pantetheine-phosphate adenylyltransferase [bacterium]MBU1674590.1 pantetheine-phosphate adenylyltransferase [bacterium]